MSKRKGGMTNQVKFTLNARPDEVRRFIEGYLATHPLPPGAVPEGYEPVIRTTFGENGAMEIALVIARKRERQEENGGTTT